VSGKPEILSSQRAGAGDREVYYARLGKALEADKISVSEHEARLDAVAVARTRAEMDRLVSDLPAPPASPPPLLRRLRRRSSEIHAGWLAAVTLNCAAYALGVFLVIAAPVIGVESAPRLPRNQHYLDAARLAVSWGAVFAGLGLLAAAIVWSNLLYNSRPRRYRCR
jgi:Domain of unknown function (DUF1707)